MVVTVVEMVEVKVEMEVVVMEGGGGIEVVVVMDSKDEVKNDIWKLELEMRNSVAYMVAYGCI